MTRTRRIKQTYSFTLLLFLLFIAACTEQNSQITNRTTMPLPSSTATAETESVRGVIFTADQIAANPHWPHNADPWTPSEADITALEAQLLAYLQEEYPDLWQGLDGYARQYWGTVTSGGNRALYANFFCDAHGNVSNYDWQANLVQVLDGGDCYFQTLYDIEDGVFVWLAINGES